MADTGTSSGASPRPLFVALAVAVLLAGAAGIYLTLSPPRNGTAGASALAAYAVGAVETFDAAAEPALAPDVTFLVDGETETRLADFKGKVVLLNLWATWCAPCRHEMPALDRLQGELGSDKFEVVAVSVDRGTSGDPEGFLKEINTEHLAFYHDPTARLGSKLGAFGMPTTLLIDEDGMILGKLVGPAEWDAEEAKALVKAAMGEW